ncbi:hypothetical protein SFRURICE_012923 [Spodoptera frugiperda]|nr:hypothetical protein SFRURICE_012923 [Spodoptera frugiperda]
MSLTGTNLTLVLLNSLSTPISSLDVGSYVRGHSSRSTTFYVTALLFDLESYQHLLIHHPSPSQRARLTQMGPSGADARSGAANNVTGYRGSGSKQEKKRGCTDVPGQGSNS